MMSSSSIMPPIQIIHVLLLLLLQLPQLLLIPSFCDALSLPTTSPSSNKVYNFIRRIRSIVPSKGILKPLALPFYENGLEFKCTECSKCCQVNGDVWLAPEEVTNVVSFLSNGSRSNNSSNSSNSSNSDKGKIDINSRNGDTGGDDVGIKSIEEFRKKYIRAEIAPSTPSITKNIPNNIAAAATDDDDDDDKFQTESWMCLKRTQPSGSCIFLHPTSKQCTIYDVRPVQCYTYPFWPSLLKSVEDWNGEAVIPDDFLIENDAINRIDSTTPRSEEEEDYDDIDDNIDRHWSPELGGCEGIGKVIDAVASMNEMQLNQLKLRDLDTMIQKEEEKEKEVVIVQREEIEQKRREAKRHWKRFPVHEIKTTTWYL